MVEFFKKSKIRLEELLAQITTFIQTTYKQSENLYTPSSPWGQIIAVIARIAQLIFFYIEDSITELNINTASRTNSILGLSRLTGHDPTRAIAAMGDFILVPTGKTPTNTTSTSVIVPNLTKIRCKNTGLKYTSIIGQDEIKISTVLNSTPRYLRVLQGELETQQFTGTGLVLQSFECNLAEGKYIDNFFVNVFVNSVKWDKYDSLYDIPKGENGFIVKRGITSGIDIYFGTNNFGTPPPLGSTIVVEYLLTAGVLGNIVDKSDYLFEFVDSGYDDNGNEVDLNQLFEIRLSTPIMFGSDPEPTELTRLLAPGQSRSFVLANTNNYINFFKKMQLFSYVDAYTTFDMYNPPNDYVIYLLLIPDITRRYRTGEDYFSVPLKYFRLTQLEKYRLQLLLEESGMKILGTIAEFVEPFFKRYALNIYINSWSGYSKDNIRSTIISNLSDYFASFKRTDYLPKSDLIAIIEAIDGVDSVNVDFISEDIEYQLSQLLDTTNMFNANLDDYVIEDIYNAMLYKSNNDIDNMSIEDKIQVIFSDSNFKSYVQKYIDDNGDIVLSEEEIPLIRGGWSDRYGKNINDGVYIDKYGIVNIYFLKTNQKIIKK